MKIPIFFLKYQAGFKIHVEMKRLRIVPKIKRRKKLEDLPNFKTYCKTTVIKTDGVGVKRDNRSREQNRVLK